MLYLLNISTTWSQKKWDGEAGDGEWKNPLNWFPNGLPATTDEVILDNQHLNGSYTVRILDTATVKIKSLTIMTTLPFTIQLVIPPQNTVSPAIDLNDTGNAIVIGPSGILINQSGATAGNAITMTGRMVIQNNGIYRHATLRGNTVLVSKLMDTELFPKGIFEFDVPGNSGYIVSVSGRQFPTLLFSSKLAAKKTYSGTGNGHLNIKGDLIVGDSSSFNLAINGNTLIKGDLQVSGKFQWQPSIPDTIGRELQFFGDSSHFLNSGSVKLGSNFRKLIIASGRLTLKSPIKLDSSYHTLRVLENSTIDLDSFGLTGPGIFQTDSEAKLMMAAPVGIADTTSANIQLSTVQIHPQSIVVFNGQANQSTGSKFPDTTGTLIIDKSLGKLSLSHSVHILDSLALIKGNILSTDSSLLEFHGKKIKSSTDAFIEGPFRRWGKFGGDWLFPIGQDSIYAPTIVSVKDSSIAKSYTIQYRAVPAPEVDSAKKYPVKIISRNEYWSIFRTTNNQTEASNEIIYFPIGLNSLKGLKGQPHVVQYDRNQKLWIQLPFLLEPSFQNRIVTSPASWQDGNFTLGEMEALALSNDRLYLQWTKKGNEIALNWKLQGDQKLLELIAESSEKHDFKQLLIEKKWKSPFPALLCEASSLEGRFIRLKGRTSNDEIIVSNIVFIPALLEPRNPFPNPATDKLYIPDTNQEKITLILQDGRRIEKQLNRDERWSWIDVSSLPAGIHYILLGMNHDLKWTLFYKN